MQNSAGKNSTEVPWSACLPNFPRLSTAVWCIVAVFWGLLLFLLNNLTHVAALRHPRPGYVSLLVPRNEDTAQYLTWIEASKAGWAIPDFHAPWITSAAFHVPLMWIAAKISLLAGISGIAAYVVLHVFCYVLAACGLVFLLRVYASSTKQAALAIAFMICGIPLRSLAAAPALLWKPGDWVLAHCGYTSFLDGWAADGFFQGVLSGAPATFGTAGALFSLALFGKYFHSSKTKDLCAASVASALTGLLHPFEFIPITAAATFAILLEKRSVAARFVRALVCGVPALAVVLFFFLPTLANPWLKIVTDLNRLPAHSFVYQHLFMFGIPALASVVLAFWRPKGADLQDWFLSCYIVLAVFGMHASFLPWAMHLKDGLDYAAAVFLARRLDQMPALMRLWPNPRLRQAGLALLVALALAAHGYFRYRTYKLGTIAGDAFSPNTAVAPLDEIRAVEWLRQHDARNALILAPPANADWMATVPVHSFASHWIFSLTYEQQEKLAAKFYGGSIPDGEAESLLADYGVRYVLIPAESPARRYLQNATLRWTGQKFLLYEFPQNEIKPLPQLTKVAPRSYVWDQGPR